MVAAIAAIIGYFAQQYVYGGSGGNGLATKSRVEFTLPDLQGKPHSISEFDGKVVVLNFWATWCPPCRDEIPDFNALQSKYGARGVQFVGVAMDEKDAVENFVKTLPINYVVLVGDEEGKITTSYGNELIALPYTVVIDRKGQVVATRKGRFRPEDLGPALDALL
ncbi:MAG: TlpA disulfide reductase family protein [Gammaproteobacteria bacterium]